MDTQKASARTQLGQQLRLARIERELTQAELAKLAEFSPSQISRWERGDRMPDLVEFTRLVKVLKADQAKLLMAAAKGTIKDLASPGQ